MGGTAAELLRKGRGVGFTDKDLGTLAKLGVNLGLVSKEGDPAAGVMGLFDGVAKGATKSIQQLSPELAKLISNDHAFKTATEGAAKSQAAMNVLLKNAPKLISDMGNVADSSFGRMIGLVNKLKDLSEGLLGILGGVGKIGGSLLLPLASGALVGGPIGLAIGGLVSGAVLAAGLKFGQTIYEGGKPAEKIDAWKGILENLSPNFLSGMLTGKGGELPAITNDKLLAAFGTDDIDVAKKKFKDLNKTFVDAGGTVFNFGKGFREGFTNSLGKVEIPGMSKIKDGSAGVGQILGSLAGNVAKIAIELFPYMIGLLEKISKVFEIFANASPEAKKATGIGAGIGGTAGGILGTTLAMLTGGVTTPLIPGLIAGGATLGGGSSLLGTQTVNDAAKGQAAMNMLPISDPKYFDFMMQLGQSLATPINKDDDKQFMRDIILYLKTNYPKLIEKLDGIKTEMNQSNKTASVNSVARPK